MGPPCDFAVATRTLRGGTAVGIWPFNKYRRVEVSGGLMQYRESFNDPSLQQISQDYQQQQFGRQLLQTGTFVPLGVTFVQASSKPLRFYRIAWRDRNVTASVILEGFDGKLRLDQALALARRQERLIASR